VGDRCCRSLTHGEFSARFQNLPNEYFSGFKLKNGKGLCMTEANLLFAVDAEKLGNLGANYLLSKEGTDAFGSGKFKGEERLFISLLETHLLNTTMYVPQKTLIKVGEQFEEAYFVVRGEVLMTQGDNSFKLGPGSVLGLSEGMVGLASKYTVTTLTSLQVKIIPFHKVDSIIKGLLPELRAILVTIIKRNLAA